MYSQQVRTSIDQITKTLIIIRIKIIKSIQMKKVLCVELGLQKRSKSTIILTRISLVHKQIIIKIMATKIASRVVRTQVK